MCNRQRGRPSAPARRSHPRKDAALPRLSDALRAPPQVLLAVPLAACLRFVREAETQRTTELTLPPADWVRTQDSEISLGSPALQQTPPLPALRLPPGA